MIKKWYLNLLLLIVCFFSIRHNGTTQSLKFGFEIIGNNRKVSIPFKIYSNLIVVDVLFEGVIPLKFIVDTGVSSTVLIDKLYSDILDIVPDRKISLIGAAGGKEVEAYIVNSVNVQLKGINGENVPLLVLKEDYLKLQETIGIKIHGILGYDLFRNFIVKINYASEILTFYDPDQFNRELNWFNQMEMRIENSKPYIEIPVTMSDSTRVISKLLIDTGASHSFMLHANSDTHIKIPEKSLRDHLGAGIAGSIEGYVGRLKQIEMGDYVLEDVISTFPDKGTYNDVIEATGRQGTVGGGILKRFKLFFDYGNDKLYYRKNRFFKESFDYDMSGLNIIAKGEIFLEPYYEIQSVRENSPASKVDLRPKDILISLNGNSSGSLSLSYINNTLSQKKGKRIRMRVKRNEIFVDVEFYLKEFI
jgi:predicted aspartyl protease